MLCLIKAPKVNQSSIANLQTCHSLQLEGQMALNCSPEFCLKLTYRYLLKSGNVPVDTWGDANFGPRGII